MDNYERLNKDIISDPLLWRLALRIDDECIDVMLLCSVEDNSLIYRHISFDKSAPSKLKAIEDIIYENPLLLSDFARIDCIIETKKFVLIPNEFQRDDTNELIFANIFPGFDGEIVINDMPETGATILMGLETEFISFLRRTFNNPRLYHHLTTMCRYFRHNSRMGNSGKMYAHLRQNYIDVMVYGSDNIRLANTFKFRDPMDAVYYILSCRKFLNLDSSNDELFISGNSTLRESITPILRKYITYVMPVIFPSSMFKAGKDAMSVPFDLIILPLCE